MHRRIRSLLLAIFLATSAWVDCRLLAEVTLHAKSISTICVDTNTIRFEMFVFLKNTGADSLTLLRGQFVNEKALLQPGHLFYIAPIGSPLHGERVKPVIYDFYPVQLDMGDSVHLGRIFVQYDRASVPSEFRLRYTVSDRFRDFYDVWTGTVSLVVELKPD